MKNIVLFVMLFLTTQWGFSQEYGDLLIIPSENCKVIINGDKEEQLEKDKPYKIQLKEGDHYIQGIAYLKYRDIEKSEIVSIEPNKQKILKLQFKPKIKRPDEIDFKGPKKDNTQQIISTTLKIPGGLTVGANIASNDDYEYTGYPSFHYAFQKGDVLLIDLQLINKSGTNAIEVKSYPDGNLIYSNYKFEDLNDKKVDIPETGIYRIEIGTNYTFDRQARLTLKRIPVDEQSASMSTKVLKKKKYKVVKIQEPMVQWVNSTTNETWKGGTAEVSIPVNLPANTVEWYYIVSASREKEQVEEGMKGISLMKDLNTALMGVSPATTALNIGMSLISQPPGSDYCDVYLLDYENQSYFLNDQQFRYINEGTRENVSSAKVKIKSVTSGQYYLGIRNRDSLQGIGVGIEVAAITMDEYFEMEE